MILILDTTTIEKAVVANETNVDIDPNLKLNFKRSTHLKKHLTASETFLSFLFPCSSHACARMQQPRR